MSLIIVLLYVFTSRYRSITFSTNSSVATSRNAKNRAAAAEAANSQKLGWSSDKQDTACERQAEEDAISLFGGTEFDQNDPADMEKEALLLSIDKALVPSLENGQPISGQLAN